MADCILVQETSFQSPLSPQSQRSQASLYSSPEVVPVDLFQTSSIISGRPHDGSPGLGSSFVLISEGSNSGEQPLSSEYVEVERVEIKPEVVNTVSSSEGRVADARKPNVVCPGPATCGIDSTSGVQKWHGKSTQPSHVSASGAVVPIETEKLLPAKMLTFDVGTQTSSHYFTHVREGATQTLPEIKDSKKQLPAVEATTPTSIFEHTGLHDDPVSPLGSPSDEVVDMSASTVLIERHISQREGRMLKSGNKELRLKIKKLTEVLEQMQKENERLKNEIESRVEIEAAQSALSDKERQIEEMKREQETECEQYRNEIRKAVEYEERTKEKFEESAKVIAELQLTISALQKQLIEADVKSMAYSREIEALTQKLKACETKALVTESENSVLNVKVNHLMKELHTLKKSKHHHHHHQHHHHQQQADERSKEEVSSTNKEKNPPMMDQSVEDVAAKSGKEQELIKLDEVEKHAGTVSSKTGGDEAKLEAGAANDVKSSLSHPKPRPRQRPHHALAAGSNALLSKASKPKDTRPPPPNRHVQALVAPKLQSVAHLQPLRQLPTGARYGQQYLQPKNHEQLVSKPTPPMAHGASVLEAEGRHSRPSFLPLKGQTPAPLQLVKQPPPSRSEVQKLAATANWVQQLPEPKKEKQQVEKCDQKSADETEKQKEKRQASALSAAEGGDDLNSLSEERIEEITRELKGDGGVVCECPICGKVLHSRESDYGVLLHVELCLQQSEAANANYD